MKDTKFANNLVQFTSLSFSFVTSVPLGFMPAWLPLSTICNSSGNGEPLLNLQTMLRSTVSPLPKRRSKFLTPKKRLKPTIVGKVKTKSSWAAQMFCYRCSCYDLLEKYNYKKLINICTENPLLSPLPLISPPPPIPWLFFTNQNHRLY